MNSHHDASAADETVASRDGFDVLDACHRQTLATLDLLTALVSRLAGVGADAQARTMAKEVVGFFSNVARQHHEDEERHVFPKLLAGTDPHVVQDVQRLQQDHHWLEEDWMALLPPLDAVANGQAWYDIETLREGVEIFVALSHDHIALEESCIYPIARARLAGAERSEMGREMAGRRRAR